MLKKQNNFVQRSFSVMLFTPVVIFAIYWSPWSYFSLFFQVVMLAMLEFYKLIQQAQVRPMRIYGIVLGLLCYTVTFAYYAQDYLALIIGYLCIPLFCGLYITALYRRTTSNPFVDIATTLLGICYIAIPSSMLHYLAFFIGTYSYQLTLGLLIMVWSQDTGAYLIGSTIGKTKLFERISPNKTWEGAVGGALIAMAVSYVMAHFFDILPLWKWSSIAIITILTGNYGDLIASLLKRSINAKHAGHIIPGHGGLLDRIDSVLLTIPVVVAFLKICSMCE